MTSGVRDRDPGASELASRMVVLRGAPFERGRAHGRGLREQIHARLERWNRAAPAPRLRRDRWQRNVEELFGNASRRAPDLMLELEGIAAGAGVGIYEIFSLNAFEAVPNAPTLGCTALARGGDGRAALIAQNWDGTAIDATELVVLVHVESDGETTVVLASAGGLGWAGISSKGVALLSTDLICVGDPRGLPSQFLRRMMLATVGVDEALAVLGGLPFPGGRTYVLADRMGSAAIVEVAPGVPPSVNRVTGHAAHANHAETSQIQAREEAETLRRIYPSTRSRRGRAAALSEATRPSDVEAFRSILADHDGWPVSICKHESAAEPSITAASLIFDLEAFDAWIALGPPCSTPYARVTFTGASGERPGGNGDGAR